MKKLKKIDNAGFSLVELLVAVVILGLIVAPLLHTFVTASGTAARSRKMGDATLASQNIAETIEANDLTALLSDPDSILGGGAALEGGSYSSNALLYTIGSDGNYLVTAGKSKFAAKVVFDPHPTNDSGAFNTINAQQLTDYSNMDAVFAQSSDIATDPDEQAYSAFSEEIQATDLNVSSVRRTIDLTVGYFVKEDGTEDTSEIAATLEYKYQYTYSCTEIDSQGNPSTVTKYWPAAGYEVITSNLFPQGYDSTKTPSIYLMYNPWYSTVSLGGASYNNSGGDGIDINNTDNLAFNLFLVKERISALTSDMETQYNATVTLHQVSVSIVSKAKVYSNAKENLMNSVGNQQITGVKYIKKGTVLNTPQTFAGYNAVTGTGENDVVSKTPKNRIYQVTISIYDQSAGLSGTPLSTFITTKLQ
ncbi:MAG: prepilin-type N-terminal cleavage/methylation domain-containing protein [Oscillospiraceae bacterium]|nr:prepilin-type N-terminal cleavage/methylation domain-containing protein [Oscillospiraceae bacterium]